MKIEDMTPEQLQFRLEELEPFEREYQELTEIVTLIEVDALADYALLEGFVEGELDSDGQLRLFPVSECPIPISTPVVPEKQ